MTYIKSNNIKLRPHHLMCTQGYSGKGYDNEFVSNMTYITNILRENDLVNIDLVFSTDDICQKCPKKIGDNQCITNDKVRLIDEKVIRYFNLSEQSYVYNSVVKEIKSKINSDIMDDICKDCEWYAISACRKNILTQD